MVRIQVLSACGQGLQWHQEIRSSLAWSHHCWSSFCRAVSCVCTCFDNYSLSTHPSRREQQSLACKNNSSFLSKFPDEVVNEREKTKIWKVCSLNHPWKKNVITAACYAEKHIAGNFYRWLYVTFLLRRSIATSAIRQTPVLLHSTVPSTSPKIKLDVINIS